MTSCSICDHQEGRHKHRCALCGQPLTVKAADWIVRQPVNPDGSLGELRVEHSPGCRPGSVR
jgi:hypothetical protein